jgi:hypothetical protein
MAELRVTLIDGTARQYFMPVATGPRVKRAEKNLVDLKKMLVLNGSLALQIFESLGQLGSEQLVFGSLDQIKVSRSLGIAQISRVREVSKRIKHL